MAEHFPFAVAAHSYFLIKNKDEAKRAFLESQNAEPVFKYGPHLNLATVQRRLQKVPADSFAKKTLSLVEASIFLQTHTQAVEAFRKANLEVIHAPQKQYVEAILARIATKVTPDTEKIWNEVIEKVGRLEPFSIAAPSDDVFRRYRQYLEQYAGKVQTKGRTLVELFEEHLEKTGLKQKGWSLEIVEGVSSARTNHRLKKICIGKDYVHRTEHAKKRIVIHEVYGHALRGPQATLSEAEGFAIVLEQLTSPRFKYRRSYRYLAVALGWGVLGQPMTFREVFEILWRVMFIGSQYSEEHSRQHAFDEVYRAFRGGRPEVAGAVFLKDSIYFDANIAIWNVLIEQEFSYNEFIDSIEGRRTLLS